ncbi:uncharacterized protein LOC134859159 [Eleginops maclovinus]|uniref:uncharacterized protein LOC134859159 n=1 Tax=Eleginops maclovinus TaxID=56733 RepID=UPI003080D98E
MCEDQKWGGAGKQGEERRTRSAQQSKQPLWRNWKDLSGVSICIAVSLLCLGVCIVVFVRSSELQSRLVSLEQQQRDAQLSAWMVSLEQVEPVIMGRLDRILDEKLAARLPKTREVREAPYSCLCPPDQKLKNHNQSQARFDHVVNLTKVLWAVPWEAAVDEAYEWKLLKYSDIAAEEGQRGGKIQVLPVEVSCRGFVAKSTTKLLKSIGVRGQALQPAIKSLTETADR